MRFGCRCYCNRDNARFAHLRFGEQIAPVAVAVPLVAIHFAGVLDTLAAVGAQQIIGTAIFIAAPADAFGVFGMEREFFSHDLIPAVEVNKYRLYAANLW